MKITEKDQLMAYREKLETLHNIKKTGYPSIDKTHLEGTKFFEKHPIIPNVSIVDAMDFIWLPNMNANAITCGDLTASRKDFKTDRKIIAKAFKELGVKKGDIICVSMSNYYQAVAVFGAANEIGAVVTYLNPYAQDEELIAQLNNYESPVFINYGKTREYNENIKKKTNVKQIITLGKSQEKTREFNTKSDSLIGYSDYIDFKDLKLIGDYYKKAYNSHQSGNDTALILFTSGSTGNPKDMEFTNKNVLSAGIYYKNSAHLEKYKGIDNKRWMGVVPFMYPYGFVASVLSTLLAGREALLAPNAGPDNINDYLRQNPGLIFGSPAFLEVLKRNIDPELKLPSLHTFVSGGDFLSAQSSRDAIDFFADHGARVAMANGSGNGELLGCCTNSMNVEYKPETVGKLVNGPEFVVIDEKTGKEVKYGENGVLCVRGKNLFKGYFKKPELTKDAMIEFNGKEYYKTGNYGNLSEDGYFTLIGRSSRFFIINTLNKVYCELVQNIISKIDVVDSCAIVPKPNKEQLFESKAYIVLKPGIEPSKEIEEYIKQKAFEPYIDSYGNSVSLKPYEVPYSITFLDTLPRTEGAEKIDYESLKLDAEEEYKKENNIKVLKK